VVSGSNDHDIRHADILLARPGGPLVPSSSRKASGSGCRWRRERRGVSSSGSAPAGRGRAAPWRPDLSLRRHPEDHMADPTTRTDDSDPDVRDQPGRSEPPHRTRRRFDPLTVVTTLSIAAYAIIGIGSPLLGLKVFAATDLLT